MSADSAWVFYISPLSLISSGFFSNISSKSDFMISGSEAISDFAFSTLAGAGLFAERLPAGGVVP